MGYPFIDLPNDLYTLLNAHENAVLLESTAQDAENTASFLFLEPVSILQTYHVCELPALLKELQSWLQDGYYAAGYFAYECGYSIEKLHLLDYVSVHQPLAWFGIYTQPVIFDYNDATLKIPPAFRQKFESSLSRAQHPLSEETFAIRDLAFSIDEAAYKEKVERIQEYIRAGDVYQINFTDRYRFRFHGSPLALYQQLKRQQHVSYSACIRLPDQTILSFSPELFFRIQDQHIYTRPMKGTAPRGRTGAEDQEIANWLACNRKNQAENVMIVDLLRNDLGRLCQIGSIDVPELFRIEQYETVFQMTSTVEGQLAAQTDLPQLFAGLFPSGSITGAPKIRAMQIIKEIESSPRGVYTGSIGYFAPLQNKASIWTRAVFNVAIRTIVLRDGKGEMGIGSGIVSDSVAYDEYRECQSKAAFLTHARPQFALIEAILWRNGYQLLEDHLQRLAASADYFRYPYVRKKLDELLDQVDQGLLTGHSYKIRLLLASNGEIHTEAIEVQANSESQDVVPQIIISRQTTQSSNPMLFHKTTDRALYNAASRFAQSHGYADVIFLNEKGEVTEGATSNLFLEKNGQLFTPPLHCGLLNGIARQQIFRQHRDINERIITLQDLLTADALFISNAIRGYRKVTLNTDICFDEGSGDKS